MLHATRYFSSAMNIEELLYIGNIIYFVCPNIMQVPTRDLAGK